jgi:hypothetical protein
MLLRFYGFYQITIQCSFRPVDDFLPVKRLCKLKKPAGKNWEDLKEREKAN